MDLFAHDSGDPSHDAMHAETGAVSNEVVSTAPSFFSELLVNLLPFLVLGLILALAHFVFKLKPSVLTTITLAYLLLVGLLTFSITPVASIISLVVGFGLSLFVVIARIK